MHELHDGKPLRERRGKPSPATPDELLQQLPARTLLDRMPTPVIGLGHDGTLVYANAAACAMLGFEDVASLVAQALPSLLADDSMSRSAKECMDSLLDTGETIVEWSHAEGFPVRTTVSTLLLRASDPILLIHVNDVTELLWSDAARRHRA
ncbi:PAS domain-containing protein [Mycobacterium sp. NPDC006124]|uniref:PAS domain-containing protein n=1 Tax=Mycobacterium sp. NPDC006124 TaxID=3156729 RepID=UPI0033A6C11F